MKVLKHAIYSYIHQKGWCEKLHKKNIDDWRFCPFVDRILLDLFPPMIVSHKTMEEIMKMDRRNLFRPGSIVKLDEDNLTPNPHD